MIILHICKTRLFLPDALRFALHPVPRMCCTVRKNRRKFKVQWIFTDGVELKSYSISLTFLMTFTPPHQPISWSFNFRRFFSVSGGLHLQLSTGETVTYLEQLKCSEITAKKYYEVFLLGQFTVDQAGWGGAEADQHISMTHTYFLELSHLFKSIKFMNGLLSYC